MLQCIPVDTVNELCRILGNDKVAVTAKWHDTEERVLRYAAQDGRKAVNGLFKQYNARQSDEESAGQYKYIYS